MTGTFITEYPHTNKNGFVYTRKFVEDLYKYMRTTIRSRVKNSSDYNVHLTNVLIKHVKHFNPEDSPTVQAAERRAFGFAQYLALQNIYSDPMRENKNLHAEYRARARILYRIAITEQSTEKYINGQTKEAAVAKLYEELESVAGSFASSVSTTVSEMVDRLEDEMAENNITKDLQYQDVIKYIRLDLGAVHAHFLQLLLDGHLAKEIADDLGISLRTATRMKSRVIESFKNYLAE